VLAEVPVGATRDELVRKAAEKLGIDPTVVVARVTSAPPPQPESRTGPATTPAAATPQAPPAPPAGALLSQRERQERHLLAMCVAKPDEGRPYIERLEPKHMTSPLMMRTVEWLKDHLDDPAEGLDPEDRELHRLVAALVIRASPEQVGTGSIRRNFMELELAALEDEIAAASAGSDPQLRASLNRQRAQLLEKVNRAEAEV